MTNVNVDEIIFLYSKGRRKTCKLVLITNSFYILKEIATEQIYFINVESSEYMLRLSDVRM